MKITTALIAAMATTTSFVSGCLTLTGQYITSSQHLDVVLRDNDVEICSYHGKFTTKQVWLNCSEGHHAYLARSQGPEYQPQSVSWDAAYATRDRDMHFGVGAEQRYVGRRVAVGVNLWAANYGC